MWLVSDTMTSLENGERSMVKMQSQIVFLKKFGTNGGNIGTAKSRAGNEPSYLGSARARLEKRSARARLEKRSARAQLVS